MPANNFPPLKFKGTDANGKALAGGRLYTYFTGTNIPQTTYTSPSMSTTNTNPIVLDAAGEAYVYLDLLYAYRLELRDANNVQIYVRDDVMADRAAGTIGPQGPKGDPGVVQEITAGANITVDNSDPQRPVIASTGGGEGTSWILEQW